MSGFSLELMQLYINPGETWELTTGEHKGTTATIDRHGQIKYAVVVPLDKQVVVTVDDLQGKWEKQITPREG